jgi:hypothetical protein
MPGSRRVLTRIKSLDGRTAAALKLVGRVHTGQAHINRMQSQCSGDKRKKGELGLPAP